MSQKPKWCELIAGAVHELLDWNDAMVTRKDVERLLDLKPRQAQRILEVAGASQEGKSFQIAASDLIVYLDRVGGTEVAAQEMKRRREFAARLGDMRRERLRNGQPLMVGVEDRELRPIYRLGLTGLPEGIEFGQGTLTLRFRTPHELMQQLSMLSLAVQGDGNGRDGVFPELERLTGVSSLDSPLPPEPSMPPKCPRCEGRGFLCRETWLTIGQCNCGRCSQGPGGVTRCPECLGKQDGRWIEPEELFMASANENPISTKAAQSSSIPSFVREELEAILASK